MDSLPPTYEETRNRSAEIDRIRKLLLRNEPRAEWLTELKRLEGENEQESETARLRDCPTQ